MNKDTIKIVFGAGGGGDNVAALMFAAKYLDEGRFTRCIALIPGYHYDYHFRYLNKEEINKNTGPVKGEIRKLSKYYEEKNNKTTTNVLYKQSTDTILKLFNTFVKSDIKKSVNNLFVRGKINEKNYGIYEKKERNNVKLSTLSPNEEPVFRKILIELLKDEARTVGAGGRVGFLKPDITKKYLDFIMQPKKNKCLYSINHNANMPFTTNQLNNAINPITRGYASLEQEYQLTQFPDFNDKLTMGELQYMCTYVLGGTKPKYIFLDGAMGCNLPSEEEKYLKELSASILGLSKLFIEGTLYDLEIIDFGGDIVAGLDKNITEYGRDENSLLMALVLKHILELNISITLKVFGSGVDATDTPDSYHTKLTDFGFKELGKMKSYETKNFFRQKQKDLLNNPMTESLAKKIFDNERATEIYLKSVELSEQQAKTQAPNVNNLKKQIQNGLNKRYSKEQNKSVKFSVNGLSNISGKRRTYVDLMSTEYELTDTKGIWDKICEFNSKEINSITSSLTKPNSISKLESLIRLESSGGKKAGKKSSKKKKVRKHIGIVQSGSKSGRLKKGYRYTGERLTNGMPKIVKVKK